MMRRGQVSQMEARRAQSTASGSKPSWRSRLDADFAAARVIAANPLAAQHDGMIRLSVVLRSGVEAERDALEEGEPQRHRGTEGWFVLPHCTACRGMRSKSLETS